MVPTLEVLLFLRDKFLVGFNSLVLIGCIDARVFEIFVEAVTFRLHCCGFEDVEFFRFRDWLHEEHGRPASSHHWADQCLVESGGDHEAAIRKFLDHCHDYVTRPPHRVSSIETSKGPAWRGVVPPAAWKGQQVSTLNILLFMRAKIREGTPIEVFIGGMDAFAFQAFEDGIQFHGNTCGAENDFMPFLDWLRDVKNEWPSPAGWWGTYLTEFGGDHRAAIMKFLDRCAEFVALRQGKS